MPETPHKNDYQCVQHVLQTLNDYTTLVQDWKRRCTRIYEAVQTFEMAKANGWDTNFKVNKCFEIENRWVSRLFAKEPSAVVSIRTDVFDDADRKLTEEQRREKIATMSKFALAAQDYLKQTFKKPGQKKKIRRWARAMVRYGKAHAVPEYQYVRGTTYDADKKPSEDVIDEFPSIEVLPFTNVFFDPNYPTLEEMPAFLVKIDGVRLSALEKNKEYFNLDILKALPSTEQYQKNPESSRMEIESLAGITGGTNASGIDDKSLTVVKYWGYYGEKDELMELTVAGDLILIGKKVIPAMPIEEISAFDDTETYLSTGPIEPIISLVEETNWKKNAAASNINQALVKKWFYNPACGIDPRDLQTGGMRQGGLIPTGASMDAVDANLREVPYRDINPSYFQEQNNFERDIQNGSYTVDTSQQPGQQALTNTATGAKIKFFESNSVIGMVRDNFEEGLRSLCYKLLMLAFQNMKGNVIIKKSGDKGFWEVNANAFRNALQNFDIQIEIDSSSLEGPENRRNEAIARWNIAKDAKLNGVPVNMEETFRDVLGSMEGVNPDKYLSVQPIAPLPGAIPTQGGGRPVSGAVPLPSAAAQDTQDAIGSSAIFTTPQ